MRAHLVLGLLSIQLLSSCKTTTFHGDTSSRNIGNSPIVTPTVENPTLTPPGESPSTPVAPTVPEINNPGAPGEVPPVVTPPVVTPPVVNPPVVTPPVVAPPVVTPPVVTPPVVNPPVVNPPVSPPVTPPVVTPPVVDPPPSKDIEFGSDRIFRIGDGYAYPTSACSGDVVSYPLSGTTYYFQFQVYENNTTINLSIGRICGVDQIDKDTFALINAATNAIILPEKALPRQLDIGPSSPWVPYSAFTVNKGTYSVVIRSKNIYGHVKVPGVPPDPTKDEYDDFLVGNIRLRANNNVKAIRIYAD